MAKTMFDNLNAIVANTLTDSIKMIDIDELHESQDNFFIVDRIEEFADTILGQGGVKDNLIVRPLESGGYEIISGHRRRSAVQYLIDKGKNVSRYLPCLVQEYSDDDSRVLDIILMNVSTRQISDSELWKSYELIDRILKSKKSSGEKFGRIREKLGELLGVSPAQVGKMQNVEKNAILAVKNAIENGDISISTANEIAKLDTKRQQQLADLDLSSVKHKDVKKLTENPKSEKSESSTTKTTPSEKKGDTNINSEEESKNEPEDISDNIRLDEKAPKSNSLESFIHKHYFDIDAIFSSYISTVATDNEIAIIEEFQKLLRKTKDGNR